jgi:hypothetical protein
MPERADHSPSFRYLLTRLREGAEADRIGPTATREEVDALREIDDDIEKVFLRRLPPGKVFERMRNHSLVLIAEADLMRDQRSEDQTVVGQLLKQIERERPSFDYDFDDVSWETVKDRAQEYQFARAELYLESGLPDGRTISRRSLLDAFPPLKDAAIRDDRRRLAAEQPVVGGAHEEIFEKMSTAARWLNEELDGFIPKDANYNQLRKRLIGAALEEGGDRALERGGVRNEIAARKNEFTETVNKFAEGAGMNAEQKALEEALEQAGAVINDLRQTAMRKDYFSQQEGQIYEKAKEKTAKTWAELPVWAMKSTDVIELAKLIGERGRSRTGCGVAAKRIADDIIATMNEIDPPTPQNRERREARLLTIGRNKRWMLDSAFLETARAREHKMPEELKAVLTGLSDKELESHCELASKLRSYEIAWALPDHVIAEPVKLNREAAQQSAALENQTMDPGRGLKRKWQAISKDPAASLKEWDVHPIGNAKRLRTEPGVPQIVDLTGDSDSEPEKYRPAKRILTNGNFLDDGDTVMRDARLPSPEGGTLAQARRQVKAELAREDRRDRSTQLPGASTKNSASGSSRNNPILLDADTDSEADNGDAASRRKLEKRVPGRGL